MNLSEKLMASPQEKQQSVVADTPEDLAAKLLLSADEDASRKVKSGLTEARVLSILPELTKVFSFYREYPDIFLDSLIDKETGFKFYFYQRIFLRAVLRRRYVYCTFPRGYSKSFLALLANYVKCVLYPRTKAFVVSPGKSQSASIVQEKLDEIWKFFPALQDELILGVGYKTTKIQRDEVRLIFKNGSVLDVVGASERARGQRRTCGIVEESAKVDGKVLQDVIIPMMNISRKATGGQEDPNDITNQSQVYITTAGDKGTYAYDRLCQILIWSVIRPKESICIGGTYRQSVNAGLLPKDFVKGLKEDGSYSELTFDREYESIWGGGNANSYFSSTMFDRARTLPQPWFERPPRVAAHSKVIMGYDVGRTSDQSTVSLLYCEPMPGGTYMKKLVNLFAFEKMHFKEQAIAIKQMIMQFQVDKLVIDGNGLGVGLVDFLTVDTVTDSGDVLPALGIDRNSDKAEVYKQFYVVPNERYNGMIWIVKANESFNTEAHVLVAAQLAAGKVQFLIDEQLAKAQWQRKLDWKNYSSERRIEILRPYTMTRILKEEMMNLRKASPDSSAVTLRKISTRMKKDKFSSFEYALWYVRRIEQTQRREFDLTMINLAGGGEDYRNTTQGRNFNRDFQRRSRRAAMENGSMWRGGMYGRKRR